MFWYGLARPDPFQFAISFLSVFIYLFIYFFLSFFLSSSRCFLYNDDSLDGEDCDVQGVAGPEENSGGEDEMTEVGGDPPRRSPSPQVQDRSSAVLVPFLFLHGLLFCHDSVGRASVRRTSGIFSAAWLGLGWRVTEECVAMYVALSMDAERLRTHYH